MPHLAQGHLHPPPNVTGSNSNVNDNNRSNIITVRGVVIPPPRELSNATCTTGNSWSRFSASTAHADFGGCTCCVGSGLDRGACARDLACMDFASTAFSRRRSHSEGNLTTRGILIPLVHVIPIRLPSDPRFFKSRSRFQNGRMVFSRRRGAVNLAEQFTRIGEVGQ